MEVATATSSGFGYHIGKSALPPTAFRAARRYCSPILSSTPPKTSLSTSFTSPVAAAGCGSVTVDLFGTKKRPESLNPAVISSSRGKRSVVTMVIPSLIGNALRQPPPNLPSYLFKNRIIYMGMALLPSVTELLLAEFIYLQHLDDKKTIYFYINSTGTTEDGEKKGYESEAFAIHDMMSSMRPPVFTLCVGNAWGEAALLLAAGSKGNRAAMPSASIMIKQPIGRFRGQATDANIARNEIKNIKKNVVEILAEHIGKSTEEIEADISRPKYFTPSEAVDYGIIDKVLYHEKSRKGRGVIANLRKAQYT